MLVSNKVRTRLRRLLDGFVIVVSSASIVLSSVSAPAAQQIIVDPSAPGTSFLQTSNGTPQIDIATPQNGVSLNQFSEFNVDQNGLILNNSTSSGVSIIGQNVTANPNLMVSGPASTIINEVTSAAPSDISGTTEVFGQSAAVIIANPNGISCNGCVFLNTTSSTLTTGAPIVNGSAVDLLVTEGTVTIGPNGFSSEEQAGIFARHVDLGGTVATAGQSWTNGLIVSGGAQRVNGLNFGELHNSPVVAAPSTVAKTSPFAIDSSDLGSLSGGPVRVWGKEVSQGINLYGDINARDFWAVSAGDLFYKNVTSEKWAAFTGRDVRQYGDLSATLNVSINADSFTLYDGRKIRTGVPGNASYSYNGTLLGQVIINADDYAIIAGEIIADGVSVNVSNGSLTNNGFLMSEGALTVVAADGISQQRDIATEYDIYFDPALQQYLDAYYAQLVAGGPQADVAAELIARANQYEVVQEYVEQGATSTATDIDFTATNGSVSNTGGAIAATNDVRLAAGADIINSFLALKSRLDVEDGCPTLDCGYKTDFHAGEILAGNDLVLVAGQDIRNEASDIAAANTVTLNAGRDVVNSLKQSNHNVTENVPVTLVGPVLSQSPGKNSTPTVVTGTYTETDTYYSETNVLAPARIASLYGNIDISAGRDFVIQGSEISSGSDLLINAVGQVIMTSYSDDEVNFVDQRRRVENVCFGKSCTSSSSISTIVTRDDGTVLVTATSNLVGRSVSISSGANTTILGARILAAVDLDLVSTGGSVLIDSTDLPDTIALSDAATEEFVELDADLIDQIFGSAQTNAELSQLSSAYTQFLSDSVFVQSTDSKLVDGAIDAILRRVTDDWLKGNSGTNASVFSTYFSQLSQDHIDNLRQNYEALEALYNTYIFWRSTEHPSVQAAREAYERAKQRRDLLAQELLEVIAFEFAVQADAQPTSAASSLDEYDLLQNLITETASDDDLKVASVALLDVLLAELSLSTQAMVASYAAPSTISTPNSETSQDIIFENIYESLNLRIPTLVTEESVREFESSAIDDDFVREVIYELVNDFALQAGRPVLFNDISELGDDFIELETNLSLQRLILEMSLILSPDSTENYAGLTEFSAAVENATLDDRSLQVILKELTDLVPIVFGSVSTRIQLGDREAFASYVASQDRSAISVPNTTSEAVVNEFASSLGEQAARERTEQITSNSTGFLALLQDNPLLTAVEALRQADSGADIINEAKAVGVQSFVSLIDSDTLANLKADADTALTVLQANYAANVGALNTAISDYNFDIRNQIAYFSGLVGATTAEQQLAMQPGLAQAETDYQTLVDTALQAYQAQLSANEATYGHLLTTLQYQCSGGGKNASCGYVTVPNTYFVNLKNAADAQAQDNYDIEVANADTQRQLDIAFVQTLFTDQGLNGQIGQLQTDFGLQLSTFATQKSSALTTYAADLQDANRVFELVLEQQIIEEDLRASYAIRDSIVEGEPNLATALTSRVLPGDDATLGANTNASGLVEVELADGTFASLISDDSQTQANFVDATAWRFATHQGLKDLAATPRTLLFADGDLSLSASQDVYVTGETALAAVEDLNVSAGRRIGLLGAINTNFRLNMGDGTRETGYFEEQVRLVNTPVYVRCGKDCSSVSSTTTEVTENVWVPTGVEAYDDLAYDSFVEIGETLQLGTLMRDVYLTEVPTLSTADGEIDRLSYARQTGLYSLTSTSISAGRDLSLNSGGDILNFGGALISGDNLVMSAETDIRNEALRHNFTLTPEHGCVGYGCGLQGHEYKAAEILSGAGLIMVAGGNIKNTGGVISAAGSLLADAQGDIVNDALTSQYLYHYINSSSGLFGLKRRKSILHRAIISESTINTLYGDLELRAGNDVRLSGSRVSAGGDAVLTASNDVILNAVAEEVANYRKRSGFAGLSYGVTRTWWNEFETAFAQIEADNISLDAGRDVTGIGALLFANSDIDITSGHDITFDAHQNNRYVVTKGWSIGISFGGSGIIEALIEGDDLLEAYVATNSSLSAVYQLATADDEFDVINGLLKLGYKLPELGQAVGQGGAGITDFRTSLIEQLNPFDWLNDNGLINPGAGANPDKLINSQGFLNGITFRLGFFEAREDWTESYVSQVIAGHDLWFGAGKDLSLVGGTIASANEDTVLYAGENILVASLADTSRSTSSGWGLSLGFTNSGLTFGADFNSSTGQSQLFTNATVTAGRYLDVVSGLDIVIMGANLKAKDIYIDAGQDLIIQSRQNISSFDSFGFNFSVSLDLSSVVGVSGGVNFADANRQYTDTPTTIVAQDDLSIYTSRNTFLLGAGIWSETGNLDLDTAGLVFDNYQDSDTSTSGSVGVSLDFTETLRTNSDAFGSVAYSNTQAITYATIGAGDITVRDATSDFHLDNLNRDPDNMQRIISQTDFEIEIPGINLKRWTQQVEDTINLIEAITVTVPDEVRNEGAIAVDLYRDMIFSGLSAETVRELSRSDTFRSAVDARRRIADLLSEHGDVNAIPADDLLTMMAAEGALYKEGGQLVLPADCNLFGPTRCEVEADSILNLVDRLQTGEETNELALTYLQRSTIEFLIWCLREQPEMAVRVAQELGRDAFTQLAGDAARGRGFDGNDLYDALLSYNTSGDYDALYGASMAAQQKFRDANPVPQLPEDAFLALGVIADFVPGLGDIKAIVECGANVRFDTCVAAAAGLFPLAGDAASFVLRRGDSVLVLTRNGTETVAEVPTTAQWDVLEANADTIAANGHGQWNDVPQWRGNAANRAPRTFGQNSAGDFVYTTDAGRQITVTDPFTIRYLNGSGGRWGTQSTRLLNYETALRLENRGVSVTSGGGFAREQYIPPICGSGGTAGCTYPDLSGTYNGRNVYAQTVDVNASGAPTPRELEALNRLRQHDPNAIVISIPKGATASEVDTIISGALP